MLRLRVRGYLRKDVSRKHLVSVIRSTMSDDRSVLISVSKPVMLGAGGTGDGEGPLSAREGGLLELVTQALSNRQIAGRLGITEGTDEAPPAQHVHQAGRRVPDRRRQQDPGRRPDHPAPSTRRPDDQE